MGTGNKSGEIKITDFGLSKQMHEDIFDDDGMDLSSQGKSIQINLVSSFFSRCGYVLVFTTRSIRSWTNSTENFFKS